MARWSRPATTRYRLTHHHNGDWSLTRNGAVRWLWNSAWPPSAILHIATQTVRGEIRRRIGWRPVGTAGQAVQFRPYVLPPSADDRRRPQRRRA